MNRVQPLLNIGVAGQLYGDSPAMNLLIIFRFLFGYVAGSFYGDSPAMNPIVPGFGKFSQALTKFEQVSAPTFEAIGGAV